MQVITRRRGRRSKWTSGRNSARVQIVRGSIFLLGICNGSDSGGARAHRAASALDAREEDETVYIFFCEFVSIIAHWVSIGFEILHTQ